MGLTISYGGFEGGYSAFNRLRNVIAESIGGSYPPHKDDTLDPGLWYWNSETATAKTHPGLFELLNHSDCDGKINFSVCRKLAKELEELLPKISEIEAKQGSVGHLKQMGGSVVATQNLINACHQAVEKRKPLYFG